MRKYHRGATFALAGQAGLFRHVELSYATFGGKGKPRRAIASRGELEEIPAVEIQESVKLFPFYEFAAGQTDAMHQYVAMLAPWAEDAREQLASVDPDMEAAQSRLAEAFR